MGNRGYKELHLRVTKVNRGYRGLQRFTGVTRGYKKLQGLQGVTREYRGLQGVTNGYRGLQGDTEGYRGLQGVAEDYKELQEVTRGYRRLQGVPVVTGGYKALKRVTRDNYAKLNFILEEWMSWFTEWYTVYGLGGIALNYVKC